MGTHPIFESDFDCLTDLIRKTDKMEVSPEEFVENLKNHPAGHELARMIFGVMSEEKFLSLHEALMPLNNGPLDHLLNEAQCKELLLKRFMKDDVIADQPCKASDIGMEGYPPLRFRHMCVLKGFSIELKYKEFVEHFKREPNLSGIAWILEQKVRRIALSDKLRKWAADSWESTGWDSASLKLNIITISCFVGSATRDDLTDSDDFEDSEDSEDSEDFEDSDDSENIEESEDSEDSD